jgi:hypothetical protein
MVEGPCPWAGRQPKFERLQYDAPGRFFLIGRLASGEPVRIQLAAATRQGPRK